MISFMQTFEQLGMPIPIFGQNRLGSPNYLGPFRLWQQVCLKNLKQSIPKTPLQQMPFNL